MTTRTVIERCYEVVAPTAKAALVPIEQLVAHWPARVISAETGIVNVVRKKSYEFPFQRAFRSIMRKAMANVKPVHLAPDKIKKLFFP